MIDDMPSIEDIIDEWDKNAETRYKQIISKVDISYHKILIPTIINLIGKIQNKRFIDVGCGSGFLTTKLASRALHVVGVDPSKEMIRIAKREYGQIPNLEFYNLSIEDFSHYHSDKQFEVAVSNMSLITIPNLDKAIQAISSLLLPKGIFVFNITHPCFWNQYRKYESPDLFEYHVSHAQKGTFIISLDINGLISPTTHFHRPLQEYFRSLRNASFIVEKLIEPFPTPEIEKLYPKPWNVPRFMSLKCIKES